MHMMLKDGLRTMCQKEKKVKMVRRSQRRLQKPNGKVLVASILALGPLLLELTRLQPEARFKSCVLIECMQALMKKYSNINLACHGFENVKKLGDYLCAKAMAPKLTALMSHWRQMLRKTEEMLTAMAQLPPSDQKPFLDLVKKGRDLAHIKSKKRGLKRNISQVSASSAASSATIDSDVHMMLKDGISDDVSEGKESENGEEESEEEPSKDSNGEEVSEGKESGNGEEEVDKLTQGSTLDFRSEMTKALTKAFQSECESPFDL